MTDYDRRLAEWERKHNLNRHLGEVAFAVGTVLVCLLLGAWWLP